MSAIKSLSHMSIRVSDLERSRKFYRDGMGFEEVSGLEIIGGPSCQMVGAPAGTGLRAVFFRREGLHLEIQQLVGEDAPPLRRPEIGLGWSHIGVRVEDIDYAAESLCALGGSILESSRFENPDIPGARVLFVTDPDGTCIELIEAPEEYSPM